MKAVGIRVASMLDLHFITALYIAKQPENLIGKGNRRSYGT